MSGLGKLMIDIAQDYPKKLFEERKQLFYDVFDNTIPKRVPISCNLPYEFCIEYAGLPLAETQWTLNNLEEALDKACMITRSDTSPFGYARFPAYLQILGAKGMKMGSDGMIQCPEVIAMYADEYDQLINNPFDFLMEKVLPRKNTELDSDAVTRSIVFAKAFKAYFDYLGSSGMIEAKLREKYGFYSIPMESSGVVLAPFDYIGDNLRSIKEIMVDAKRYPEKIADACESLLPLNMKNGLPMVPSKYGQTFIPLHIAPYLGRKEFDKLYWPGLYKTVHSLAANGQPCNLFCEQNWMRYMDYLEELPAGTRILFEYGDPQLVKDRLGKKFIISGFYPLTYLQTATKQQCIDKAKELIDILAPGGNYIFDFDKGPLSLSSVNVENYTAVLEYVSENTDYPNAGQLVTEEKFDSPIDFNIPEFKSKYYSSWKQYREKHPEINPIMEGIIASKLQPYEEMLFAMVSM